MARHSSDDGQINPIGERVSLFRKERGLNLSQLAAAAHLSKSYISSIEAGETPRPSGETLYAIAEALGVTMSDLLGRRILTNEPTEEPASLLEFAHANHLPEADIKMLASIRFRGDQPKSKERWAHIYSAIRQTEWMDRHQAD
ncbi:MAG TPA: helix-turn-helix transcriptional regulator [Solirubrobacteraceae bacterium]|jgi:transcriptional regulator with XRE-family HTH domain|nr:helix-turn-helix transcriptional regulator [Solirubrobacteraceae bacterium]